MNVETECKMGDGENWTNGKVQKTKSMENSASAIMKKLKNGSHFINIDHTEKFQITDPPKSLGLLFSGCWRKQNISISHYEKIEKWLSFH